MEYYCIIFFTKLIYNRSQLIRPFRHATNKNAYTSIWNIRQIITYAKTFNCSNRFNIFNRKVSCINRLQIYMTRSAAIEFESQNCFIGFDHTIPFIFSRTNRLYIFTYIYCIRWRRTSISYLIYIMSDIGIAPTASYS